MPQQPSAGGDQQSAGFVARSSAGEIKLGQDRTPPNHARSSPEYDLSSDTDREPDIGGFTNQCSVQSLKNGAFMQEYKICEMLGQGAFGIVFAARRRGVQGTAGEVAVKLIDKVETPPGDIERETQIHATLDHPNIVKVYDVIDERFFVCIVTDRCRGGDMVRYLQAKKRRMKPSKILHIVKQMLEAVAYLHSSAIVHRDVKADNFLLDHPELMDPSCRVLLADFGFACYCRTGDRLQRRCGTRNYWAPELWDRSYAQKVDVWAVGVTLYGMLEGTFPFHTEWDVKRKGVTCHPMMSPKCMDCILKLLTKTESRRPTAAQALEHKWVSSPVSIMEPVASHKTKVSLSSDEDPEDWYPDLEVFRAEKPDPAITERRLELVGRLGGMEEQQKFAESHSVSSCESAHRTPTATLQKRSFSVLDRKARKMRTFEWWSWPRVEEEILPRTETKLEDQVPRLEKNLVEHINTQLVTQILQEHNIDTEQFGKGNAKTLERFAAEVDSGASRLMLDASKHKALVRVVDVVLLRLCHGSRNEEEEGDIGRSYLIVTADEQVDGQMRENLNRLPGTKKRPFENVREAAQRILIQIPNPQSWDNKIVCNFNDKQVFEEEAESPSYPGVRTIYRTEVISAYTDVQFVVADGGAFIIDSSASHSARTGGSTKFYSWITETQCLALKVKLSAPRESAAVSSLVPVPIGMKLRALGRYLKANNVDPSLFGQGQAKSLQELSTELTSGESSLMASPQGDLVRLVDVVLLKIFQGESREEVLVVTKEKIDGTEEIGLKRLPGSKRRPDENHFLAAKRVLARQLNISEDYVKLDVGGVNIVQEDKESPSYPGLRTVYVKRVITAELAGVNEHSAQQVMSIPLEHSQRSRSRQAITAVKTSSYAPGSRFESISDGWMFDAEQDAWANHGFD